MPPPPPPPPPMGGFAPAPPPPPSFGGSSKASGSGDRSALLTDIHKGFKLKKTVTNDRSSPIVSSAFNNKFFLCLFLRSMIMQNYFCSNYSPMTDCSLNPSTIPSHHVQIN